MTSDFAHEVDFAQEVAKSSCLLYIETVEASTSTRATLQISRQTACDRLEIGQRWLMDQLNTPKVAPNP